MRLRKALEFLRAFLGFHFGSFGPAIRQSWRWASFVATMLGVLIPFIKDLFKITSEGAATMSSLSWEIPLYIAIFFFAIILFYVPFSKYQKLERERDRLIASNAKPQLRCDVEEIHLRLESYSADCFVQVTLHNDSTCATEVQAFEAIISVKGKNYPGYRQWDLERYVLTHNSHSVSEYGEDQWRRIAGVDEALTDIYISPDVSRSHPVNGWLHFYFPELPSWRVKETGVPTGGMVEIVDHDTGEREWEPEIGTYLSRETLDSITLTAKDLHLTNPQFAITDFTNDPSRIIRSSAGTTGLVSVERLMKLSKAGDRLLKKARAGEGAEINREFETWESEAAAYIERSFNPATKMLFLSDAPLDTYPGEISHPQTDRDQLNRIYTRVGRLNNFIKSELGLN
jgi:hypothetical protein